MLQIVVGAPGSGKSYMAVNYLKDYCKYNELYDEHTLPGHILIISNIEGLRVNHWKYPECMKEKTVEEFWTIENIESIQKKTGKHHIIVALDEAHKFFPASFKSDSVYNCFAEHRHIGMDVFFLTQGIKAFSPIFLPLVEFIVFAQPRSKKLGRGFLYHYKSKEGLFLYPKMIPCKKDVFRVYKSMRVDEANKPKSAAVVWASLVVCLFVLAGGIFYMGLSGIKQKGKTVEHSTAKNSSTDSHDNVENNKNLPLVGLPSPPAVASPLFWKTVDIDGWIESNTGTWLLIAGRRVLFDERFRNLQKDWLSVEMVSEAQPSGGGNGDDAKAERGGGANAPPVDPLG